MQPNKSITTLKKEGQSNTCKKWMGFAIMRSERNQTPKDKHCIIQLTGVYRIGKFIAAESRIGTMGAGSIKRWELLFNWYRVFVWDYEASGNGWW